MITSVNQFLSISGKSMKRSAIREILKHLQKPGMISFADGLPAPETFPVDDLKEITIEILEKNGPDSLQYGTTEGDPLLRKMLVERHNSQGISLDEHGMKPDELEETIIILKDICTGFQEKEIETGVQRLSQVICDELECK